VERYLIFGVVCDHDEELCLKALGGALWNEQVVRPTAAAEVELFLFVAPTGSAIVEAAERALERDSY